MTLVEFEMADHPSNLAPKIKARLDDGWSAFGSPYKAGGFHVAFFTKAEAE